MGRVKAISLWQPWATLVAVGAKTIETRNRRTSNSGRIAIHAAGRVSRELNELCTRSPFKEALAVARLPVR